MRTETHEEQTKVKLEAVSAGVVTATAAGKRMDLRSDPWQALLQHINHVNNPVRCKDIFRAVSMSRWHCSFESSLLDVRS